MQGAQRLDHIHGLRGIAALAVVIQHALQMAQEAGVPWFRPLLDTVNLGRFGVVLFFLISGVVIPFSFRGSTPMRRFVIGRAFRLYPAYWLSIPVLALVWTAAYGRMPDLATVLANFTMLQGFFGLPDIGPGYWTLKFEIMFYALCALLFWRRLLNDAALNGVFVLAALVAAMAPVLWMALTGALIDITPTPFFIGMFLLGMLLRRWFVEGCDAARKWSMALLPLAMLAGVLLGGWIAPVHENANVYFRPLALTLGMVLPAPVLALVMWRKAIPGKPIMYLGTISYSLYLFQDVGLHLLPFVVSPALWPVYVTAVIALSIGIADLVYRFVETPMIALGRKLGEAAPSRDALKA